MNVANHQMFSDYIIHSRPMGDLEGAVTKLNEGLGFSARVLRSEYARGSRVSAAVQAPLRSILNSYFSEVALFRVAGQLGCAHS